MTASRYTKPSIRYEIRDADGSCLNYSAGPDGATGWLAKRYLESHPGAYVVEIHEQTEVAPYERVLIDSGIPEEHWPLLRADMTRCMHMARGAGRPSDAMRSAVSAFKAGLLTEESHAASRPSGYYPED